MIFYAFNHQFSPICEALVGCCEQDFLEPTDYCYIGPQTKRLTTMAQPNWKNRTMWTGDNLDVMRGMNSESVDLIYLDPPFNSNRTYSAPIGSEAAGAAFKDTWTLSDVDNAWHGEISDTDETLYSIIDAAGKAHGKSMKSYLIMMAIRLLEMKRLLKDTGSLYLHCDPTASHYLKMTLDHVFGQGNFRSEITWKRTNAKGLAFKGFPNNSDSLLYYTKSNKFTFNRQYRPHDPSYIEKFYRHIEPETGRRYRLADLTNPNRDRPNLTYEFLGINRVWRWTKDRMQEAYDKGLIVQRRPRCRSGSQKIFGRNEGYTYRYHLGRHQARSITFKGTYRIPNTKTHCATGPDYPGQF